MIELAIFALTYALIALQNLTIIGSVAEVAERHDLKLGFIEYMKIGVPVTFLSVLAGVLLLEVILCLALSMNFR